MLTQMVHRLRRRPNNEPALSLGFADQYCIGKRGLQQKVFHLIKNI